MCCVELVPVTMDWHASGMAGSAACQPAACGAGSTQASACLPPLVLT
jgi:hypothetical protein